MNITLGFKLNNQEIEDLIANKIELAINKIDEKRIESAISKALVSAIENMDDEGEFWDLTIDPIKELVTKYIKNMIKE